MEAVSIVVGITAWWRTPAKISSSSKIRFRRVAASEAADACCCRIAGSVLPIISCRMEMRPARTHKGFFRSCATVWAKASSSSTSAFFSNRVVMECMSSASVNGLLMKSAAPSSCRGGWLLARAGLRSR